MTETRKKGGGGQCLARSVAEALAATPGLEAVTIDHAQGTVSLATLGKADARLEDQIQRTLEQAAEAEEDGGNCRLLSGAGDCRECPRPLPPEQQRRVSVQHSETSTTIARVTCPTAQTFWRWRNFPIPHVVQREVEFLEDEHEVDEWKGQMVAASLCGLFGLAAWQLPASSPTPNMVLYALAYLAGSWFTAQEVWERLRKGGIDVHFLMLAVAAGSASIGAWGEGAMLLFLFSFSGALEHFALGRTQREIRALFRDAPKTGLVLMPDGSEREMPVGTLRSGMRLLIKPGAQFPVDAQIEKGETAADESNLTGEAAPVEKKPGDKVFAGTLNLWGAAEVLVLKAAAESSLQKIVKLIKEAQQQKAPAQRFTDKFSTYYTYVVLVLSLVMFFVWWLASGHNAFVDGPNSKSAFYRAMTLLVVASPCALVLSIPSAVLAAIAWGARHGVLFRGGAAVEKLAGISSVALDKTGTLTTGEMKVETVESFPAGREKEIANVAYAMERLSTHPLARAVTRYGKQMNLTPATVERFQSVTGQGVEGLYEGIPAFIGRREWVLSKPPMSPVIPQVTVHAGELSEIWVRHGEAIGRVGLRDDLRPESQSVLVRLHDEGLKTVVLTGDKKSAAEDLRSKLQVDEVMAELKPEDKLREIRERSERGEKVAMVGDGVNDAPALAAAYIGVAMGARGSDAALEQADVVLMHDKLENFLAAFQLSQRARTVIRQNLVISLGMVLVLVSFALMGKIPLTLGVLGHEGSTVVVVMNSLRLLFGSNRQVSTPMVENA